MTKKVEISYRTIILTILTIIGIWLLYLIRNIIMEFFVALLIMAILNPLVTKLSKYKIPRGVSVLLTYLLLFATISFTIAAIIPSVVEQTTSFTANFPKFLNNLGISSVLSDRLIQQFITQIAAFPAQAAKVTVSVFSNILNIFTVLVFAFYLLSEREKLDDQLSDFLGEEKNKETVQTIDLLEQRLGRWARGEIALMLVVGGLNYLGLKLLGIPFALPLAILAGLLEIVPYIGPILAAVPAVLIGLGISPILGLAVASLAFLVQQTENYVLVPKIMQRSTGVNPVITLLSLSVGFKLGGVVGLLISVPVYITSKTIAQKYLISSK